MDLWLEAIQQVATPQWMQLLLSRAPKDPDGVASQLDEKTGTARNAQEMGTVTVEQGLKVHEVRQGSADLVEHALQFEDRMKMLKVPPSRWLGLFEASLNAESRVSFWRAHRAGIGLENEGLQALVRGMLQNQGLHGLKAARSELDQVRQRKGESAPAFATRLHTEISKYEFRTGRAVTSAEALELLVTRLWDGQRLEALLPERYTEAAVFESQINHGSRRAPDQAGRPVEQNNTSRAEEVRRREEKV